MALLKVFVVHDSKVGAYMQPFFCRSPGEALRIWEATVNDGKSIMSSHPSDFSLFEIAEYDESTGRFNQLPVLKSMGTAVEFKRIVTQGDLPFAPQPLRSAEAKPTAAKSV